MIIAIDGYSSCGKSTLAKALAKKLSLIYVDTGAMYRAVTYHFIEHQIDLNNELQVESALDQITITFQRLDDKNTTFLNGVNIEKEIRTLRISSLVSEVSALSAVRNKMVKDQRAMASDGLVMDGRDIGTVVFPNADVKIFLTAAPEIRIQRRFEELIQNGQNPDIEEVRANINHRDYIDTHRSHSPLRKADNAIEIDNSFITRDEQIDLVLHYINELKA